MSDVYTTLGVSPQKKRRLSSPDGEVTPKRLRLAPPTPPASAHKSSSSLLSLPTHLLRLNSLQIALQHALSHALATAAVSPSSDTGIVRNILNHVSLTTYSGFTTKFEVDDLKRLCWLWEWDGRALPESKAEAHDRDDENPFLDTPPSPPPKDWTRGSMGFIISPTSHFSKSVAKRVPVYGVGVEVEMDIDKNMTGGMAAVARWTADGGRRRKEFSGKLRRWIELHHNVKSIPNIPIANLPEISTATKASALTRALVSASPKGMASLSGLVPSSPSFPTKSHAKSATKSPTKSPAKQAITANKFAVPFPTIATSSASAADAKNSVTFPQTPSSRRIRDPAGSYLTPFKTPLKVARESTSDESRPCTPVHQRGAKAETAPSTPTTSRRQALYERIHQRSLTATPSKSAGAKVAGSKMTIEQIQKLGQEEMRRRCLLGRLGGVAESVWMLFSAPTGSSSTPALRKRKALPNSEVESAIIKSSPVPMSTSEATESLKLLTGLCPFFLRQLEITGEEWLEMPASTPASNSTESGTKGLVPPPSPGSKVKDSATELLTRSPRRVKREAGGLREVREIIRKELELQD
ncbi:hypothetical protein SERLA73DRAFT_48588 [Serpula lacrymans var. lacrymans S7.3]|uniref:DNA replication factor Cdt1 C-terminal domain-containing protein n=1 Tax=Serpula lacrymans var. lacrymans (strain S7.3) TaxID=936435 RepID=F8PNS6_SERL3|nr:hypothetical protein SERLA73DRAFT_48588 [Serpula lacrymans var. lacrymans S7.3]